MAVRIERVPARATWALRQQVLRPHQTVDAQRLPSDDLPTTGCFAAYTEDGTVIGTSLVMLEDPPFGAADIRAAVTPAWRLRGMATREGSRGSGVGTALLDRAISYVAQEGGVLVWCNARIPAVTLYRRAGFREYGAPWHDPEIGPHVVMWRSTDGSPDESSAGPD